MTSHSNISELQCHFSKWACVGIRIKHINFSLCVYSDNIFEHTHGLTVAAWPSAWLLDMDNGIKCNHYLHCHWLPSKNKSLKTWSICSSRSSHFFKLLKCFLCLWTAFSYRFPSMEQGVKKPLSSKVMVYSFSSKVLEASN